MDHLLQNNAVLVGAALICYFVRRVGTESRRIGKQALIGVGFCRVVPNRADFPLFYLSSFFHAHEIS